MNRRVVARLQPVRCFIIYLHATLPDLWLNITLWGYAWLPRTSRIGYDFQPLHKLHREGPGGYAMWLMDKYNLLFARRLGETQILLEVLGYDGRWEGTTRAMWEELIVTHAIRAGWCTGWDLWDRAGRVVPPAERWEYLFQYYTNFDAHHMKLLKRWDSGDRTCAYELDQLLDWDPVEAAVAYLNQLELPALQRPAGTLTASLSSSDSPDKLSAAPAPAQVEPVSSAVPPATDAPASAEVRPGRPSVESDPLAYMPYLVAAYRALVLKQQRPTHSWKEIAKAIGWGTDEASLKHLAFYRRKLEERAALRAEVQAYLAAERKETNERKDTN